MEYFDVLDSNRRLLDYTKERGSILEKNEYNQGAELWIINNNKLLMTKRSLNKSHSGMWETPGGCSQVGESTIDTIIREANEEIGMSLNQKDIVFLGTQLYKKQFVDIFKTDKKVNTKNIKLQIEEVSDINFISKAEFLLMKENNEIVPSVLDRYELIKEALSNDW